VTQKVIDAAYTLTSAKFSKLSVNELLRLWSTAQFVAETTQEELEKRKALSIEDDHWVAPYMTNVTVGYAPPLSYNPYYKVTADAPPNSAGTIECVMHPAP
jgi:hypothetical protein